MSNLKKVAKNALSLLTAELVRKTVAFVYIAVAVRYLSVGDFGVYTLIMTFLLFAGFFADFGIEMVVTRDVSKDKTKANMIFSNAVLAMFVTSIISWIAMSLIVIKLGYPQLTRDLIIISGISLVFEGIAQPSRAILKAFEHMEVLAVISSLVSLASAVVGIVALKSGFGLPVLIWIMVGTSFLNALITFSQIHGRFVVFSLNFDYKFCWQIFKQALPIAFLMASTIIIRKIDILMLSKMKTVNDIAIYGVPVKMIDFLTVCTGCAVGALFPHMSAQSEKSFDTLKQTHEKSLSFFILLGFAVAVGITVLAERIIVALFGMSYVASAFPLKILIWGFFFSIIAGPMGSILIILKDKLFKVVSFVGLVVILNIVLNMLWIPRYSYIGASVSTIVCSIAVFLLKYSLAGETFKELPNALSISLRPCIAAIVMGVIMYGIREFNLAVVIITGFFVYGGTLFLLGEFKHSRYDFLKRLV